VGTKRLGRKVGAKTGTNSATIAVRARNAAPDDAELGRAAERALKVALGGARLGLPRSVDVRHTLAKVSRRVKTSLHTLNLDQRSLGVLLAQVSKKQRHTSVTPSEIKSIEINLPLVAHHNALGVQPTTIRVGEQEEKKKSRKKK
jgi:hypothetical protein